MKTVWKYQLVIRDGLQHLSIPEGARIVHVGMQWDTPTFWLEVNPEAALEFRTFQVYGTGHEIPNSNIFIGTAVGNPFVWHIYERK